MRLLKCLSNESLLELASIPAEIPAWKKWAFKGHLVSCARCRTSLVAIEKKWRTFFAPEPEVTSSLLSVYSRLQKDETLVLKGWKLSEVRSERSFGDRLLREGWLLRGGVSLGGVTAAVFFFSAQVTPVKPVPVANAWAASKAPLAQIRYEDKNSIKVQYVQPELLQSIEFETTSVK